MLPATVLSRLSPWIAYDESLSDSKRKFIVVVPSFAIREGVLKTLRVTDSHFRELYGNIPNRYYVYDLANLSRIRHFGDAQEVDYRVVTSTKELP